MPDADEAQSSAARPGRADLVGRTAELRYRVSDSDTATALGSGDVPVLATPRLLAWSEAATVASLGDALGRDHTSVGTHVALEHRRATRVGREVVVRAEVVEHDGAKLRLVVVAEHVDDASLAARGEVTRAVVDRAGFLARL